jgi:hypothetical protein
MKASACCSIASPLQCESVLEVLDLPLLQRDVFRIEAGAHFEDLQLPQSIQLHGD